MDPSLASRPVIIECALNGATPRERNPHVPKTSEEIAADALRCIDAGASIIHTHIADSNASGEAAADLYLEHFRPVLAAQPDAVIYPTICFQPTVEEKVGHFPKLVESCRMRQGICDPGSLNLAPTDENGVPVAAEWVYTNSPSDIRYKLELCERYALGPTLAIFEPGFLRYALAYHQAGQLPRGALVRLYFGGSSSYLGPGRADLLFGLPPTPKSLDAYLAMLDGSELPWSVAVLSGDPLEGGFARYALEHGGDLRVGLEDFSGSRTPSNLDLVQEAVALCKEVGRPVARPDEVGKLLDLPR